MSAYPMTRLKYDVGLSLKNHYMYSPGLLPTGKSKLLV